MKQLYEITKAEFEILILGYKHLLRDVKAIRSNLNPHLWNELAPSATQIESALQQILRNLQIMHRSAE